MPAVPALAALCCSTLCLLFLAVSSVHAQSFFPCDAVVNGTYYDLSPLSGVEISGYDSNTHWQFFLDLCRVSSKCKRDGAMACQMDVNTKEVWDLAFPNDDVDTHYWTPILSVNGSAPGIQLTAFGSGLNCDLEGFERRSKVQVLCDTNSTVPTTFSGFVEEGPICTYTMKINHTAGCGTPYVPPPPPASPSCPVDESKVTGAGFGVGALVGTVVTLGAVAGYFYYKRRLGGTQSGGKQWRQLDDDKGVYLAGGQVQTTTDM